MEEKINRRKFLEKTAAGLGVAALIALLSRKLIRYGLRHSSPTKSSGTGRPESAVAEEPVSPYLRFNYDKPGGGFTYDEFMQIGRELENVVKAAGNQIHSKILTCEDNLTYLASYMSRPSDGVRVSLANRKNYSVDEMTQAVWDKSHKVDLIMDLPEASTQFMISLDYDPNHNNKLSFYGQCLGDKTQRAIKEKFCVQGQYKIGDGFPRKKISTMMI